MEVLIFYILFCMIAGSIASRRGRSGIIWFVVSLIISPLISLIFILILENLNAEQKPSTKTHVKCPDCAELVLKEAKICKHCGCKMVATS